MRRSPNVGALVGHGGVVVFDDTVDMAQMARVTMEFCDRVWENARPAAWVPRAPGDSDGVVDCHLGAKPWLSSRNCAIR